MCAVFAATPRCYDAKAFSRINVTKFSKAGPSQIKSTISGQIAFCVKERKKSAAVI